jgi:lipopolysaccharide transport system ATP-binding protein
MSDQIPSLKNCEAPSAASAGGDFAIRIRGVSKSYSIYQNPRDLLLELLFRTPRHSEHWALRDVSLEVRRGEVVGVVGPNGAGKSTLLKIIAGILVPTAGDIAVNGRLSAILQLGSGFHPDYSGRDNVITGAMCLGMSREEAEARLPWIVNFAELSHVIDQPFKTYSSGMQARLTFSTAISLSPEILIIDEALAAGDSFFVTKCFRRIREICASGATVMFVSHGTAQVAQLCDRAVWIDGGMVREIGPAREVAKHYDYETHLRVSEGMGRLVEIAVAEHDEQKGGDFNPSDVNLSDACSILPSAWGSLDSKAAPSANPARLSTTTFDVAEMDRTTDRSSVKGRTPLTVFRKGPVTIDRVRFYGKDGKPRRLFRTWEDLTIEVGYSCPADRIPVETLGLAIGIERDSDLSLIAQFNTVNYAGNETHDYHDAPFRVQASSKGAIRAFLPQLQMMNGKYLVSLGLMPNIPGAAEFYEYHHRAYSLQIVTAGYPSGAAYYPIVEWSHQPSSDAESKLISSGVNTTREGR